MDPDSSVVQLCAQGMQAETEGRNSDAHALFRQAWYAATDDYEACIAAHYLARHQNTPEDTLRWNKECLDRADRVGDDRVRGFYPSLHLNMARAHSELGNPDSAREHFRHAAERIQDAPAGPYRDGMRFAIAAGLRSRNGADALAELLDKLCARADLTALGLLLPPYLGDLGTTEDKTALLTALQMVHAGRSLPDDEQALLRRAIGEL
jgi:tetratricopeptide (TPR) repeat protein